MRWPKKHKKSLASFLSTIIVFVGFFICTFISTGTAPVLATAGINQQLSFTGKFDNATGGAIADSTYNVEFKIYQDGNSSGTGSTLMWTEDWLVSGSTGMPSTGGVSTTGGTFQVNLGSICAFSGGACGAKTNTGVDFNQQTLWLSMQIGNTSACTVTSTVTSFNTACGGDGEMSPFIRLTAVPYSLNALSLGGIAASSFVQLGGTQSGNINIGTGSITAAAIDVNASAGALGIGTSNAGTLTIGNASNSSIIFKTKNATNAFQLQNASGASILNIDTTGSLASSNLVANASFETTISGSGAGVWVIKKGGAGTPTLSNDSTTNFAYNQLQSAKVITTATANDGIKQQLNTTLSTATTYNVLFYVRLDTSSAAMTSDLNAGYSSTGSSDDTACSLNMTVITGGWTKYTCSFTTPGTTNSSNYFYIRQTDAAIHIFYVDAVLVQLASSADANYRDAQILIDGTVTSNLVLQNSANSTNALTVQNASGGQVFSVDTTDSNLVNNPANPSFEVNTTGWTAVVPSGTVTIARDTSQFKYGIASLKLTTSGVAAQGARYTLASGSWPAGSYTVSFSALNSGTAFSAVPIVKFGNGADNACSAVTQTSVPSTAAWTRYSAACTFSGTTTSIAIEQNEATAHTWYIDAVQLESGGTPTAYGLGQISLSGAIVSPVTFKNQTDSAVAFQVQNSTSVSMLTIDNLNNNIEIGSQTTDANAVVLVLDYFNNATDPTGGAAVNGAMYYNTARSAFRCYEGGSWGNCLGGGPVNQSTATQAPTAGTDTYITNSQVPLPASGFRGPTGTAQDGSKVTWRLVITKTAAGTGASTITIRVGTAGTISDTARCTAFSTGTATAVADVATIYISVFATAGGSTTTLNCSSTLTHVLAATGWNTAGYAVQAFSTQTSFDSTPAGTKIGLSFNGGTGTVATIQSVDVTAFNM